MEKILINWKKYELMINEIVNQIKSTKIKYDTIIALPRGGLPIATSIAHRLGIKSIDTYLRPKYFKSNILLIDDISDTGKTLESYMNLNIKCDIACLCYKPHTIVKPKYFAEVFLNDEWVVFPWENINDKMVKDNE